MFIYKIINSINNKVYIGKTINIENRWKRHLYLANKKTNRVLYDAMNKYGYENFSICIIEDCEDCIQNEREVYWIEKYNSTNRENGYNMTKGGDGGDTWTNNENKELTITRIRMANIGKIRSEEFREKMRKIALNRPKMSDTIRGKISKTRIDRIKNGEINLEHCGDYMRGRFGENHHFYGKHHTQESKDKISLRRTGKTYEDLFGEDKAREIKDLKSENFKGDKNINYINIDIEYLKELVEFGYNNIEISKLLNISKATVIAKFKKAFDTTPGKYRRDNNIKIKE